jgi:hypothetical protein
MDMIILVTLLFTICTTQPFTNEDRCEHGSVRAPTCEIAIRHVLQGLRPNQDVMIHSCV